MTSDTSSKLDHDAMQRYWLDLSAHHLGVQDDGLAAICYAGMPPWFNRFLDVYQRKAMARLLTGEDIRGAHVLDIGTGVGRWARWFAEQGARYIVGIDAEPARLEQAGALGGPIAYGQMPVERLAFSDASFDMVNSVTVLQHVDDDHKRESIGEISRVLKAGGKAIFFELTHTADDAAHVFPWSEDSWRAEFVRNGLQVERTVGDQYTPLLRILKTGFSLWKGERSRDAIETMKHVGVDNKSMILRLLLPAVLVSYPIEEVMRFLPIRFAKITGFLCVKQ